jgi:hypothetical protein
MVAPSKNEVLHNGGRRKNEYKSTKMSVGALFPVGWSTGSASLCYVLVEHGGVAKPPLARFNLGAPVNSTVGVCAKMSTSVQK